MRRRFGRGRRGRGPEARSEIDPRRVCERILESGLLPLESLAPLEAAGVPAEFAVLAEGATREGRRALLAFAPRRAADAALALVAEAGRRVAEGFAGELFAVAPEWNGSARRRLALLRAPLPLRALAIPGLAEGESAVAGEPLAASPLLPPRSLAAGLERAADRELLTRALAAFEGLAAKHGGSVRAMGERIELVLLARSSACLRLEAGGLVLETLLPDRSSSRLALAELAAAMDRLEGTLRRRLNDRRTRGGEEGLRADLSPALAALAGLRGVQPWPLGGADPDLIDLLGVGEDGRPALGAIRERLALPELAAILDAALELVPALPWLLAALEPPVRLVLPKLVLAAREFDPAVLHALAGIALEHSLCDVESRRGREPELRLRGSALPLPRPAAGLAAPPAAPAPLAPEPARDERGGAREREDRESAREREDRESARERDDRESAREREDRERGRERERDAEARERGRERAGEERRGWRGRERGRDEEREPARPPVPVGAWGDDWDEQPAAADAPEPERPREGAPAGPPRAGAARIEEISLFDLDDAEQSGGAEPRDPRRRRGRRRRGRRGGPRSAEPGPGRFGATEPDAPDRAASARDAEGDFARDRAAPAFEEDEPDEETPSFSTDDEVELPETLAPLAEGAEELEDRAARALAGEPDPESLPREEEEEGGEEDEPEEVLEAGEPAPPRELLGADEAEAAPSRLPRRRAAIVVHADRGSLVAAILLARDLRLLEGFWVYPQAELMTFFRGVATDLKEDTPIYMVGFTASPARDALQAASLYRGRLAWFDHHDWPPEDLEALRGVLGAEHVHVVPGSGSPLPAVVGIAGRRSRFSDKLVELLTGRFSEHDYERWGRLWWHRLGELAGRTGERRADIDPLLMGRPSDLARSAARVPPPPPPAEVEYVASHDFRLVHFGGIALVVVPTPPGLDRYLVARVARERYGAPLSLAWSAGSEALALGADEARGQRGLDLSRMVQHLASKHDWIDALPDEDRIACLRVRGLAAHPELLDEVIREIGMGRSILEG